MSAQEDVILGILDSEPNSPASLIAEALTMAQEYIHPRDRIRGPISGHRAGQYLVRLHKRGLVECSPPAGRHTLNEEEIYVSNLSPTHRGRRVWRLKEVSDA